MNKTQHSLTDHDRLQVQQSLAEQQAHREHFSGTMREYYYEMTAETPLAAVVHCEHVADSGWWLYPQETRTEQVIVFIHGGAYMLGSAQAYRGFASQLAMRTGYSTFVLDYPLAPEHPFPAAPDRVIEILNGLVDSGIEHIALVGDSAGAALSLVALQHHQLVHKIRSAVLFSPWTDLTFSGDSFNDPSTRDPIFQPSILRDAAAAYLQGASAEDQRASPLLAQYSHLPPLMIQVGTEELLLDDATRLAAQLAEQGGEVQLDIFQGMHHVFQRDIRLDAALHALDSAASFIRQHQ
ncbi:alpha/beta hydrolase [Pantoea sp. GL120224-02]|uniref:alpha/beta hydrolase n=1 Tax=Pantoea sp. GL120224-02 TaxID=1378084 RepID=UPI000BCC63C6|nr:alpha/beta hydrolase [Pantoea sp. GL120224-02]SNY61855.1 Acetyl esterase/lipase [Pantoea sp. GL120224-02]